MEAIVLTICCCCCLEINNSSGDFSNSFFTFIVVKLYGYSYQEALAMVFVSGTLFLLLSATGIRDKIINSILFRLRRWHFQEHAEVFTANELETFKGVSENIEYPYLNGILAAGAIQKMSANNPFLYRSISVFQSNQTLVNGEYFFDYIQHYAVIYERLFREGTGLLSSLNKINGISLESNVVKFLNTYAHSYRVGDKYLRNLFECMLLFYFDKFGDNNFSEFMTKAFLWVYRLRFEYQRISFKTIEDAALSKDGLLTHIEKSITPAQVMRFIPKLGEIKFDNIDKKIKEIWSVKDYAEK